MNAAEEHNVIPMAIEAPQPQAGQPGHGPDSDQPGNIDKIREILFGAQIRDYERRFLRLEERLIKEAAEARDDSRRRIEALETYAKQEIGAITDRLRVETQQRSQSTEELMREFRDTARNIGNKLAQMDEHAANSHREMRQQLLDQSKMLSDDIRNKYDEVGAALSRESRELEDRKADRTALANLFSELSMRLSDEFKLPGEK